MSKVYPLSIIFTILALALPACRPVLVAKSISLDEQISDAIVSNEDDISPIAYVNGEAIQKGVFVGLTEVMVDTTGIPFEQAYQGAFNLLVQNTLIDQEAVRRGYTPSDEEAIERTREHVKGALKVPGAKSFLEKKAERLGVKLNSEEFIKLYAPTMKKLMPTERLNQQILEQAGNDPGKALAYLQALASDLLNQAKIEIVYENLPPEAAGIHIPTAEELPVMANSSQQ